MTVQRYRCHQCACVATRAFCYPAEPWTPYCPSHPPQYGTAGDIPIAQLPDALDVLRRLFPLSEEMK